jgi:hypothetical protein
MKTKDAETAFSAYENVRSEIKRHSGRTTGFTNGIGFNYVEFILRPDETHHLVVEDGRFVRSLVFDLSGELLARNRRMVFVKDSTPKQALLAFQPGQGLHVLGVPRLNMAILPWRIRNGLARPEVLRWNWPYEIVIVGVFGVVPADQLPES